MKKINFIPVLLCFLAMGCGSPSIQVPVTPYKQTSPVLIGKKENPLLTLKVNNPTDRELCIKSVCLSPDGSTDLSDIETIRIYFTGNSGQFNSNVLFGQTQPSAQHIEFNGCQFLKPGDNYFWVSIALKPETSLQHKINLNYKSMAIEGAGIHLQDSCPLLPSTVGYAVRQRNDDGSKSYRIPGLVSTPKGTLIAVYDIRWNSSVDLQEDIDVGVSRSLDGGQTWLPMQKAIDMGEWGGRPQKENGIGDPAILVDPQTGRIWIAALWLHGKPGQRAWWASKPGITPAETGQLVLAYSDDEGESWSEPINITSQVKKPEWYLCFNGPGMGITMQDGTLVFAAQYKDKKQIPHSTILYSKDKGKTWQMGTGAKPNTTEAQVVELTDGSLMLNMRDDNGGSRSVCTTHDFGKTWTEHPSSRSALPESVCQASIIRIRTADGKNGLAFFNPATTKGRHHSTLKLSFDEGLTWPEKYHTLIYEPDSFGYSCLAQINPTTLGVLFEGASDLYFQQIDLEEILKR